MGNESVLIIGGGPSTLDTHRWVDLNVDYKITVSTAYLNETIRNTEIDCYVISVQTDFNSDHFKEWYDNNPNCQFIIEDNHFWKLPNGFSNFNPKTPITHININENFTLGILPRIIIWLIKTKQFSDIYFVGLDGYSEDGKAQHAFIKNKNQIDINAAHTKTYDMVYSHFNRFYEYITHNKGNVKLHNVGYGHDSNILTKLDINKEMI